MTGDAWLTLGILVVMFGLLIWDRWPTWAVFGLALAAVLTFDLAPESAALSGFSNSGVLTVVVLYIVAAGMYRTGAISMLIGRVVGQPHTEQAANMKILPLTALGSAYQITTLAKSSVAFDLAVKSAEAAGFDASELGWLVRFIARPMPMSDSTEPIPSLAPVASYVLEPVTAVDADTGNLIWQTDELRGTGL